MDFNTLLSLVNDNEDAKAFINNLKETSNTHVSTINKNETLINSLKGDLEKFKLGNSLVKSELGLEQLNQDSLSEALGKLKGSSNNNEEVNNLKAMIDKLNGNLSTQAEDYEAKITNINLDTMIANATAGASIQGEEAFSTVKTLLKSGVVIEDGKAIYKENGVTKFNADNQPLTLESKLESIKTNPIYAGFFGKSVSNGGGSTNNEQASGIKKLSEMSETERMNLFKTNKPEFQRLARENN